MHPLLPYEQFVTTPAILLVIWTNLFTDFLNRDSYLRSTSLGVTKQKETWMRCGSSSLMFPFRPKSFCLFVWHFRWIRNFCIFDWEIFFFLNFCWCGKMFEFIIRVYGLQFFENYLIFTWLLCNSWPFYRHHPWDSKDGNSPKINLVFNSIWKKKLFRDDQQPIKVKN